MNRKNNGLQAARVDQLGESTPSAPLSCRAWRCCGGVQPLHSRQSRCISGKADALAARPLHVESGLQAIVARAMACPRSGFPRTVAVVARQSVGPALALAAEPLQWDCMQWDVSCSNAVGFTNCCCMQWDCSNANGPRVSCHRRGSAPPREAGHAHGILANIITF